jgi:hypothetical protein
MTRLAGFMAGSDMSYSHTQYGKLHYLLWIVAAGEFALAWVLRGIPTILPILVCVGLVVLVLSLAFVRLTVCDEVTHLAVRYGPLPIFSKQFPYAELTAVEPCRSTWIDGRGIHYMPGRGWIYNLSGYDCVKLALGDKTVRIGTDEPEKLAAFLRTKIAS